MRRSLGLLLVIIMATTLGGCISGGGGGSSDSGGNSAVSNESNVTLLFNLAQMLAMNRTNHDIMLAKLIDFITMSKAAYATETYTFITSIYIGVTGSGMPDIIHEAGIQDPSIPLEVTLTVTNGPNRRFYIELKDRNNWALYSGDLIIDVGNAGASQEITVDVAVDTGINAEDYVAIGRQHLENRKLELAYIAFDTAVSIKTNHPEANFFRGLTHLLLLVQKDDPDPDVDAAQPNTDIAAMLNLYTGLADIYSSSIAPDIYNEDYGTDLDSFDWVEPSVFTTDSGINVLENVILPELKNIISDFSKAEADSGFSTTFTPPMYFDISSTIKVDRADVYILEAIAYGLKAYYNQLLAYRLRTDSDYWYDNLKKDKDAGTYNGVEEVIDNDPDNVFDFAGDADSHFSAAKSDYSTGLNKLKSGLEVIDSTNRSTQDKEDENHIFNVVDIDDSALASKPSLNKVNFTKVINNIDQIGNALNVATIITSYDEYGDASTGYDSAEVNLLKFFSSDTAPYRNTRPEFYYHIKSDTDVPIFDTNNPSSSLDFVNTFKSVLTKFKESGAADWTYINYLEDLLRHDMLPTNDYRFSVSSISLPGGMSGNVSDFNSINSIKPVLFDEEDSKKPEWADLTEAYVARDTDNLYLGIKFKGAPYSTTLGSGEYLSYNIYFNAAYQDCDWYSAPVVLELHFYYDNGEKWEWRLRSRGSPISPFTTNCTFVKNGIMELRIPLSELRGWINTYQSADFPSPSGWDNKELFLRVSFSSNTSLNGQQHNSIGGECLASGLD